MGFSATGNLLPGSIERPDTVTIMFLKQNDCDSSFTAGSTNKLATYSINCSLNNLGYIPVVSTATGLGRALLGLVHTIAHLACSSFSKNRDHHLAESKLGAKNIERGLVEAIPVIGNISMFIVDQVRMNKFETMAKDHINKNKTAYYNHGVMFVYGQEIARRPIAEFNSEMNNLNRKPTLADIENIIRTKV